MPPPEKPMMSIVVGRERRDVGSLESATISVVESEDRPCCHFAPSEPLAGHKPGRRSRLLGVRAILRDPEEFLVDLGFSATRNNICPLLGTVKSLSLVLASLLFPFVRLRVCEGGVMPGRGIPAAVVAAGDSCGVGPGHQHNAGDISSKPIIKILIGVPLMKNSSWDILLIQW